MLGLPALVGRGHFGKAAARGHGEQVVGIEAQVQRLPALEVVGFVGLRGALHGIGSALQFVRIERQQCVDGLEALGALATALVALRDGPAQALAQRLLAQARELEGTEAAGRGALGGLGLRQGLGQRALVLEREGVLAPHDALRGLQRAQVQLQDAVVDTARGDERRLEGIARETIQRHGLRPPHGFPWVIGLQCPYHAIGRDALALGRGRGAREPGTQRIERFGRRRAAGTHPFDERVMGGGCVIRCDGVSRRARRGKRDTGPLHLCPDLRARTGPHRCDKQCRGGEREGGTKEGRVRLSECGVCDSVAALLSQDRVAIGYLLEPYRPTSKPRCRK